MRVQTVVVPPTYETRRSSSLVGRRPPLSISVNPTPRPDSAASRLSTHLFPLAASRPLINRLPSMKPGRRRGRRRVFCRRFWRRRFVKRLRVFAMIDLMIPPAHRRRKPDLVTHRRVARSPGEPETQLVFVLSRPRVDPRHFQALARPLRPLDFHSSGALNVHLQFVTLVYASRSRPGTAATRC